MGLIPSRPAPISTRHDLANFSCGRQVLDDWLKRRALRNDTSGASRTFVICEGKRVIGYYALAAGAVTASAAPGKVRRNMPDPVPVMVLGRLAVDSVHHGKGLGRALLRDAILRTLQAAEIAGLRAILVHAPDEDAARFYESCGFHRSPIDPLILMITLADARHALGMDENGKG